MRRFKRYYLDSFFLSILLSTASCNTTEPPDPPITPQPKATLTVQDVSCLEAWIKLELENIELPVDINVFQDSIPILEINNLTSNDTIIYIDSLQPSQTYKFHSIIQSITQSEVKSNELTITTLTPTSQEFTWQVYSWGMHSSSEIKDVAIIDENNIWCVGEIYLNDSLGIADPQRYNGVRLEGQEWSVIRIPYIFQGQSFHHPIQSILSFNEDNIWFCGNGIILWDGDSYLPITIPSNIWGPYQMNKLWGSSSNDLYVVGNEGNTAWYNGINWQKIETGTDINFRDIYGSINKDNNEVEIIALASNSGINQRKKLVRIKNQTVETLPDSGLADYLSTVWFISGRKYCIGGQGYYESNTFGPVWERDNSIPQIHITSIRGAGLNDIVLGGSFGLLMHYNGLNWMNYAYITASYFDVISEVAIKGNTVVAAGFKGSKAVVMIGRR